MTGGKLEFTLPAAASGRARSLHSQVKTVPIVQMDGRTCEEPLEFFEDSPEGRAALILAAVQIGPEAVRYARQMLEAADRIREQRQIDE